MKYRLLLCLCLVFPLNSDGLKILKNIVDFLHPTTSTTTPPDLFVPAYESKDPDQIPPSSNNSLQDHYSDKAAPHQGEFIPVNTTSSSSTFEEFNNTNVNTYSQGEKGDYPTVNEYTTLPTNTNEYNHERPNQPSTHNNGLDGVNSEGMKSTTTALNVSGLEPNTQGTTDELNSAVFSAPTQPTDVGGSSNPSGDREEPRDQLNPAYNSQNSSEPQGGSFLYPDNPLLQTTERTPKRVPVDGPRNFLDVPAKTCEAGKKLDASGQCRLEARK